MNFDTSILEDYYNGQLTADNHWLYNNIKKDEKVFEKILYSNETIQNTSNLITKTLDNEFEPFNESIILKIFPDFYKNLEKVTVILSVGLPSPYDALVRNYQGREYIIFDVAQFLNYKMTDDQIITFSKSMLTHEGLHYSLHNIYPLSDFSSNFSSKLNYLCFDEGFAHLLSIWEDIFKASFEKYERHYLNSQQRYFGVLANPSLDPILEEADSGLYWDKYGAIFGCLTLAKNRKELEEIFKQGPLFFENLSSKKNKE